MMGIPVFAHTKTHMVGAGAEKMRQYTRSGCLTKHELIDTPVGLGGPVQAC